MSTLTERRILELIQDHYGPQNTPESVDWTERGEAVLWVQDHSGTSVLLASLTSLANWLADGTIASESELKRDWLQINDS